MGESASRWEFGEWYVATTFLKLVKKIHFLFSYFLLMIIFNKIKIHKYYKWMHNNHINDTIKTNQDSST